MLSRGYMKNQHMGGLFDSKSISSGERSMNQAESAIRRRFVRKVFPLQQDSLKLLPETCFGRPGRSVKMSLSAGFFRFGLAFVAYGRHLFFASRGAC